MCSRDGIVEIDPENEAETYAVTRIPGGADWLRAESARINSARCHPSTEGAKWRI